MTIETGIVGWRAGPAPTGRFLTLEDEVMNLVLRYAVGPMDILLGDELDTLDALKRIDQELAGIGRGQS